MELKDLQSQDVNQFINNYRTALKDQYDASMKTLNQQRENDYAKIMAGANRTGMMYSNFPQQTKIKYDTQSFYPTAIKTYQTYQSSLDKLRENALNLYNQNKKINEAIADLNDL